MLEDTLKMCIAVDRYIIMYKDYAYTESILDQLYSKFTAHQIDSAVVITKGILSTQFFSESYSVFNFNINFDKYSCYVSKFDVNKILHLLQTSGIRDVRIIDKFGYYVSLNRKNCCMIDTLGNAYSVVTFLEKVRDINYNRYSNLDKVLINCNKKYAVRDFIDMTTFYDEHLLHYFRNINTLYEKMEEAKNENGSGIELKNIIRVLVALSAFAYTELPISKYFELNQNKINLVNANPIRREDDFENVESYEEESQELPEEGVEYMDEVSLKNSEDDKNTGGNKKGKRGNKYKKKQNATKEKQKKPVSKGMMVANAACIILSIGMLGATVYANSSVKTYTEKIGILSEKNETLLESIEKSNLLLSDYQAFSTNLLSNHGYGELYSTLANTKFKGEIKAVSFDQDSMICELYVKDRTKTVIKKDKNGKDKEIKGKSKEQITKDLRKVLEKNFTINDISLTKKSDKDGYFLYSVYLSKRD